MKGKAMYHCNLANFQETVEGFTYLYEHCAVYERGLEQCEACFMYQRMQNIKAHYPVPSTMLRVTNAGLANGYFDFTHDGWITWGVFDNPTFDGTTVVD